MAAAQNSLMANMYSQAMFMNGMAAINPAFAEAMSNSGYGYPNISLMEGNKVGVAKSNGREKDGDGSAEEKQIREW